MIWHGLDIIAMCSVNVAPETIQQIIKVESNGNPLAIHINGSNASVTPKNAIEAEKIAYQAMANGHSVDMGLMQVNSRNLSKLGYKVSDMFDPCKNIKAGSSILKDDYISASKLDGFGQDALKKALSAYNTGNFYLGFHNGYVDKYYDSQNAQINFTDSSHVVKTFSNETSNEAQSTDNLNPYTADTAEFSRSNKYEW